MPLCNFCLGGRKKKPQISGPLHLLLQSDDLSAQNHAFHSKVFLDPLPCQLCQFPIYQQGSCCQYCNYSCHYSCQSKVLIRCEGEGHHLKKNYDGIRKPSPSFHSSTQKTTLSRPLVYPNIQHYQPLYHRYSDYIEMDLTYITERVIAMVFPFMGMEKLYRDNLKEVTLMLKTKHGDKYMIFNLSERRYDISQMNRQILNFGWPDRLAPPLERLCSICKAMDSWLNADPHHIVVLHCKGGKERTGIVIEAYRHYSNICASADQALDRFAMKRFYDDKIGNLTQPSQKRYVRYFSGLLSGSIKINSSPLYLNQVVIHGVPNFDGKGGCRAFLKIYQGLQPIYSSGIYNVSSNMRRVVIPLDIPLQLRGDILIKCYHKSRPSAREIIFRCQFHTCAVSEYALMFSKEELDDACIDKRFPEDSRVEIKFSSGPDSFQGSNSIHEMPVPSESSTDPIIRWDSYENFDIVPEDSPENANELDTWDSVNHTQGPVDGNLYATVGKKRLPLNGAVEDLVNGVHTISMDSGISSTSGQLGHPLSMTSTPLYSGTTNGTLSSSSSPVVKAEIHNSPISEEHSKLDEVLSGMLQDVQSIPDIKPSTRSYHVKTTTTTYTEVPPSNVLNGKYQNQDPSLEEEEDSDTPYHSRKDSQPFTYLVPTSPAAQRKIFTNKNVARTPSPIRSATLPMTSEHKHSSSTPSTPEPKFDEEFLENPNAWLYKQQQKLKERQEARFHTDRHHRENRLINELRNAQSKFAPFHSDSSFEDDAYLSDTLASLEAFSSREPSPVKGVSRSLFSTPLHINTYNGYTSQQSQPSSSLTTSKPPIYQSATTGRGSSAPSSPLIPNRSSSRDIRTRYIWPATQQKPVQRQRSDTSHDRERPFVTVKRAHEQARKQADPNYPTFHQTFAYTQYQQPPQNLPQPSYPQMVPLATSSPTTKTSIPSSGLLTTVTPSKPLETISPVPASSRLEELELTLQTVSSPSTHIDRRLQKHPCVVDGHSDDSPSPSKMDDRPATPGFPVQPRTPYSNREPSPLPGQAAGLPPKSPTSARKDRSPSPSTVQQLQASILSQTPEAGQTFSSTGQSSPSVYVGQSCRSSLTSLVEPSEIISDSPVFMKDTSKYWYKPNISREDAINVLKDKPPGTFIVRDSNSFPGAYGLALKVAIPPPNIQNKSGDISNELVRHFLIEPTSQGVRLKGCANEPVFGSLSALVYQHSITPMALPCKLLLPKNDVTEQVSPETSHSPSSAAQLLAQGAACSVLYLYSMDVELLTGPEAIRKSSKSMIATKPLPVATTVHFKVSSQGITVTDNNRKLFFRRHYPVNTISHCGLEPSDQRWSEYNEETGQVKSTHRIFGFVAAKTTNPNENQCHLFAELEPEQPAFAIVNFVTKVMMGTSNVRSLVGSNNA